MPPLVALAIAAVVGDILILIFGQSPGEVYRLLLEGTWGNAYGFGQVIYKATTLTFTGLAVASACARPVQHRRARASSRAEGFAPRSLGSRFPPGRPALLRCHLHVSSRPPLVAAWSAPFRAFSRRGSAPAR